MEPKYENSLLRVALDPEVIRVFKIVKHLYLLEWPQISFLLVFQVFQAENNVMKQFSTITTLSTAKRNAKIMPHADSDRKLVVVNDILVVVPPPHQ